MKRVNTRLTDHIADDSIVSWITSFYHVAKPLIGSAEVQRKTFRSVRANTLTQFEYPAQPVQKRSRPSGANPLTPFVSPRSAGAESCRPSGANTPAAVRVPSWSVQKIYTKELLHPCSSSFHVKILIEQGRNRSFLVDTRDRLGEHRCNRKDVDLIQLLVVGQRDGIEDGQFP